MQKREQERKRKRPGMYILFPLRHFAFVCLQYIWKQEPSRCPFTSGLPEVKSGSETGSVPPLPSTASPHGVSFSLYNSCKNQQ